MSTYAGERPTLRLTEEMRRAKRRGKEVSFLKWALRIPEPKTGRLSFYRFPFQVEMYRTMGGPHRQVVCRKATQIGVSAMTIRWALYEADKFGYTGLYVFPTEGDVHDFSDARVQPMCERSEYLQTRLGDPFNKGLKRIGSGLVYFRGSGSKTRLDSVDADALALDEYDTLNAKNIPDAERRLSGVTSAGLIRRVGVPSLPEAGIAERYTESDQRKWVVPCTHCDHVGLDREKGNEPILTPDGPGAWQLVDFWWNVVQPDGLEPFVGCAGCQQPLNLRKGRWVAQNPSSHIPGFHVSRLIVPDMPLEEIIRASKRQEPSEVEVFYNKDLGLPFVSKQARLGPDEVHAAQRVDIPQLLGYTGLNPVTMGVDVASERALSIRISEHVSTDEKISLWIGELEDDDEGLAFDKLSLLMDRYRVNLAAVDALPETRMARQFQGRHPGRVFIVHVSGVQKQALQMTWEMGEATVNRTLGMDAMVEMIRRQRNLLPGVLPEGYVQHLTANIRKTEKDDKTGKKRVWWEPTRPDDWAMAEVFDLVATELWWIRQQVEGATAEVYTPLDDMVELRRAEVSDYGAMEYRAGPGEEVEQYGAAWGEDQYGEQW